MQTLDAALFRFINQSLTNPVFDRIMPLLSGARWMQGFVLLVVLSALVIWWRGAARARLCVTMMLLAVALGDPLVVNTIKKAVARPRPCLAQPGVIDRIGCTQTGSMPSAHAANWFAATMAAFLFYRRSARVMLPLAAAVGFSRVYNGVHYPSDVLAGAILGAGYAAALVLGCDAAWRWAGSKWFPLWWQEMPCLAPTLAGKESVSAPAIPQPQRSSSDQHWLRAGYALIFFFLLLNWAYLASGTIELSGDEAYQWLWSKHLALSYYSKPPLIAYAQFLGTTLWGDTAFGVRFLSPLIAAIIGVLLLRFFAREVNARCGVVLSLVATTTPLLALGATILTVDPLSAMFWICAMLAGWGALRAQASTAPWLWVGLWMGLGFLSKYTALFQWLCWAVFFALWPPARMHLRRPGPYLAVLINIICALPVLIWNYQHQWITVTHVANDASATQPWEWSLGNLFGFLGAECALLNPVFFIGMIWASIAFWRRQRGNELPVYCFSMGAPLFLCYLIFTLHSAVKPNWIAPSVLPLACVMILYWESRWRAGARWVKTALNIGLGLGALMVLIMHDTNLIQKVTGHPLPMKPEPMTRLRAYSGVAQVAGEARRRLLAEGKPVFIIGNNYTTASLVSFYLPEAKAAVKSDPLVYCRASDQPENQFYFWPGYLGRRAGQNAIYVQEVGAPPLVHGWIWKWLAGERNLARNDPPNDPAPTWLARQFGSVTNLGLSDVLYRGRVFHTIQLFECRDLR